MDNGEKNQENEETIKDKVQRKKEYRIKSKEKRKKKSPYRQLFLHTTEEKKF